MDVEIELVGVTVRMTHTWSLVHIVKAPCWRKGIGMEAHVHFVEKKHWEEGSQHPQRRLGQGRRNERTGYISGYLGLISGS